MSNPYGLDNIELTKCLQLINKQINIFAQTQFMALSIKQLIEKNKTAYQHQYYIESVYLSYGLICKALRQLIVEEKIGVAADRMKLSEYIHLFKEHYTKSPTFKRKLKKNVYKSICTFHSDFKSLNKELKYQYSEMKLKNASKLGMEIMVHLNTTLIKIRSNR